MRVLLTGAAGWVGVPATAVLAREHAVRALDLAGIDAVAPAGVERMVGDVASWATAQAAVAGMDAVVHLAVGVGGYRDAPDEMVRATVGGTVVLLEAAHRAGIERVVLVSSSVVVTGYPRGTRIDASTPPSFAGLYGLTKWLQEEVGRQYAAEYGMVVPILRPWVIVDGPTRRMRLGEPLDASDPVGHDGPFGWIDRTDFADACALALTAPLVGAPVFHLMPNPIGKRWFDTEPAERLLGWRPRWDFAGDIPPEWRIADAVPADPPGATPPSLRSLS